MADFHLGGTSHVTIELLITLRRCGPITGNVSLRRPIVIPSSPLACEELIRRSAADSSGSVAGCSDSAPLHTRGGRGGRVSPVRAAARACATSGPTETKWWFSLSAQRGSSLVVLDVRGAGFF